MESPNLKLAKNLNRLAIVVSVVVLLLVGVMRRVKITIPESVDLSMLPALHSILNSLTALLLILALYYIRRKEVLRHRRTIYLALTCSALFLISYVAYHITTPETIYGDINGDGLVDAGELALLGSSRTIYLILLLSHISLAAVSFPLILFTFIRGFTWQVDKHRKMARWVYWIWLYVAITGPICYFMLKPYY
ncbi:MAG: DUF420 domain-containing protein [Saprospiraceae bacterium]|nr:DUF420 domain-containing protein [Saprospiraceae bacterium]